MFSTSLSLIPLVLLLLASRVGHCLDPKDVYGNQAAVKATERERQEKVKEFVEGRHAPDEIMQDPIEYIKNGDQEDELMEDADSLMTEKGRKMQNRRKEKVDRIVKKTQSESDKDLGGGPEKENRRKRPLDIKKLLKGDSLFEKSKKKKPDEEPDSNRKGNKKGPPRRRQNKGEIEANDDEQNKKVKKRGNGKNKNKHKGKNGFIMRNDGKESIVTTKINPVFSFTSM